MTPTGQSSSRQITPDATGTAEAQRRAADTRLAMDHLLAASPALRLWMQDNYRPPAAAPASPR